jgi:hypothetical protein
MTACQGRITSNRPFGLIKSAGSTDPIQRKKEAAMTISPHVILFVLFMLTVVQATRIDEMRQHKRNLDTHHKPHSHTARR